jgi:hypothetical protein
MPRLHQNLPDGPIDLIGDVHGELEALDRLLGLLGVDIVRGTASRPLVFLGDLVDRGPDSPGVVARVRGLVDAGIANCVLGNHEQNLLEGDCKEGSGWFFGHGPRNTVDGFDRRLADGRVVRETFASRPASATERDEILRFFGDLPLIRSRTDLRVVHAAWSPAALAALPEEGDVASLSRVFQRTIEERLIREGVMERARVQRAAWGEIAELGNKPGEYLPDVARRAYEEQMGNPIQQLLSGPEAYIPYERIFYAGGKWRFVTRQRWWEEHVEEQAVVVGHYWRLRGARIEGKVDVWDGVGPFDWAGPKRNVTCIDYSVGRRFAERAQGRTTGFVGGLAALRWPERRLVFDDDPQGTEGRTMGPFGQEGC